MILEYKNIKFEIEFTEYEDLLGSYNLEITEEIKSIISDYNIYIDEEFIICNILWNIDSIITLIHYALEEDKPYTFKISNISNIYWLIHDIEHAKYDIDYIENNYRIPLYIEIERLVKGVDILETKNLQLSYEEVKEILSSIKEDNRKVDIEDYNNLHRRFELHINEEIYD